jgi:hypothetical protein
MLGDSGNIVIVSNCYSTGNIGNSGGGIVGASYGAGVNATHCYSSGSTSGTGRGIYSGSSNDNVRGSNNYSEANNGGSGWNDTHAASSLTGVGTTYLSLSANTAYIFGLFWFSPYTLTNINTDFSPVQSVSQTVILGNSNAGGAVANYKTFSILSGGDDTITIDTASGVISTSSTTPLGTYTLLIYGVDDYSVTQLILSVVDASANSGIEACCANTSDLINLSYGIVDSLKDGNRYIVEKTQNRNMKFPSYAEYMKYKAALGSSSI